MLVTRLWYLREVDPRTMLYTGLTRDGTFLIENGKITKALKNFRFNESPLFMLNNLETLGRPGASRRERRLAARSSCRRSRSGTSTSRVCPTQSEQELALATKTGAGTGARAAVVNAERNETLGMPLKRALPRVFNCSNQFQLHS